MKLLEVFSGDAPLSKGGWPGDARGGGSLHAPLARIPRRLRRRKENIGKGEYWKGEYCRVAATWHGASSSRRYRGNGGARSFLQPLSIAMDGRQCNRV